MKYHLSALSLGLAGTQLGTQELSLSILQGNWATTLLRSAVSSEKKHKLLKNGGGVEHGREKRDRPQIIKLSDYTLKRHFLCEDQVLRFGSRSEYACGIMLERHVDGFYLEMSKTMQVPLAGGRACDFLVNGVWVEFHPIQLFHEFQDKQAYRNIKHVLKNLEKHESSKIYLALTAEKRENYFTRRHEYIRRTLGHNDFDLICPASSEEFYKLVLGRFGKNLPSLPSFQKQFKKLIRGEKNV